MGGLELGEVWQVFYGMFVEGAVTPLGSFFWVAVFRGWRSCLVYPRLQAGLPPGMSRIEEGASVWAGFQPLRVLVGGFFLGLRPRLV